MDEQSAHFPDRDRLSILVGTILLAYTLTHFVSIPTLELDFALLGILFPIRVNFTTLVTLLVAGLTASGTAWLLESQAGWKSTRTTFVHWLLPTLTALVLLQAINQLPFGGAWWVAAVGSGLLLMLILSAEFIAQDTGNKYYIAAEMGITALSIILFLILALSLHASGTRLFYRVPVLSLAALLVYLRILHLRSHGRWTIVPGSVAFLLIGELAAVLHYWPLSSLGFAVALTGPLYALVEISDGFPAAGERFQTQRLFWPILIIAASWVVAILV
ncbi:MAG: hypothetical protein ACK2TT_12665 [Anaerolineales bacterium]|jgi:hypothetical protein